MLILKNKIAFISFIKIKYKTIIKPETVLSNMQ